MDAKNTNFFTNLSKFNLSHITLSISFSQEVAIVSVLPKSNINSSDSKKVRELTLTASVDELDQFFFQKITDPIKHTESFFSNIEKFEASLKKAEKDAAYNKANKDKIKTLINQLNTITSDKDFNPVKDYKKAIKKANEILELDANATLAKKTIDAMKQYDNPSLF